ncbi:MAG: trypsin-like serine protease [Armatimonadetes bacterium]|nr:trypsin-like serine protease [Armatimonadota bacterium]
MKPTARYALCTSALLMLGIAPGKAIIRLATVPDSLYLAYGSQFPYVVRMEFNAAAKDYRSATLINDQWLLTAGHNYPGATYQLPVLINGQTYTTVSWIRHPSYNASNLLNGYDISLVKLDRRVLDVASCPLYQGPEWNFVASIVGFGFTGDGLVGQTTSDLQRRAGTNLLEQLPGYTRISICDFDDGTDANNALFGANSTSPKTPTELECNFGSGDSGGPALIQIDGTMKVCGVISFRGRLDQNTNSTIYGSVLGCSRIQPVYSWITQKAHDDYVVTGHVSQMAYAGNPTGRTINFKLMQPGTNTVVESIDCRISVSGEYSFVPTSRGTYDLVVKSINSISARKANVNIAATGVTADFNLTGGDTDGDNMISVFDYLNISNSFDLSSGDAGYDPRADVDGDMSVTIFDYAIVSDNFDKIGQ